MFLNKLDRAGASFRASLLSLLAHRLHPKPMALALPVASFDPADYQRAEPGVQGLVDLVRWEVWKWNSEGEYTRHALPVDADELKQTDIFPADHPVVPHLLEARTNLLDNLSMFSESLMETLLALPSTPSAYLTVPADQIIPELRAATLRSDVLPVLCGSAFKHVGTELVMDYVGLLFPSPVDAIQTVPKPNAPLRMLAWKVAWDKRKGWMTFVRVYSGKASLRGLLAVCLMKTCHLRHFEASVVDLQRYSLPTRKSVETGASVRISSPGGGFSFLRFRWRNIGMQVHAHRRHAGGQRKRRGEFLAAQHHPSRSRHVHVNHTTDTCRFAAGRGCSQGPGTHRSFGPR